MTNDSPRRFTSEADVAKHLDTGHPHAITHLKDDGTTGHGHVTSDGSALTFEYDEG